MTLHVDIGDAETRLSELVAAALRGEDVVLDEAGAPQVRLVPIDDAAADPEAKRRAAMRRSAFGMWADLVGRRDIDVGRIKREDEELQESRRRKFGDPA